MNRTLTIEELQELVNKFVAERDWGQFHNPKDLAIGIVTEGAELLDLFRFKSEAEGLEILKNAVKREQVAEEICDVLYFILIFASRYGIDLGSEMVKKLSKNAAKYPVEKFKGSNKKYNE